MDKFVESRKAIGESLEETLKTFLIEEKDIDSEVTNTRPIVGAIAGAFDCLSKYVPNIDDFFNVEHLKMVINLYKS